MDARADGYARSEACLAMVLISKTFADLHNCHRYARVLASGTNNDGRKAQGITYPSSDQQFALMRQVYQKIPEFDIHAIAYMEMHGTGTKAGDAEESQSISKFAAIYNRRRPLPVHSTKPILVIRSSIRLAGVDPGMFIHGQRY